MKSAALGLHLNQILKLGFCNLKQRNVNTMQIIAKVSEQFEVTIGHFFY